jgi:epoxyqueuosine reductase QueG
VNTELNSDIDLTSRIHNLVIKEDTELFGVASPEVLWAAPKGFRPQDILPDCKAVIVVGKRLSDATVDTTPSRMFDAMYSATNVFLDMLVLKIASALIQNGYGAIGLGPHSWNEKFLQGDISFKHAAIAAGLGRFGLQSLVLTPEFGPRQRWSAVITDAPLKCSSPLKDAICKPEACGYACIISCPANVFSERKPVGIEDSDLIPDGLWYYWNIDKQRCMAYRASRKEEFGLKTLEGHACAACKRACPIGSKRLRRNL